MHIQPATGYTSEGVGANRTELLFAATHRVPSTCMPCSRPRARLLAFDNPTCTRSSNMSTTPWLLESELLGAGVQKLLDAGLYDEIAKYLGPGIVRGKDPTSATG
jgi:hypothetical protein